jgi:peroxidase
MALAAQTSAMLLMVAISVLGLATGGLAQLKNGFYTGKCGANDVESIVQGLVKTRVGRDAAIVAQLLRLQFHECAINVRDTVLVLAIAYARRH